MCEDVLGVVMVMGMRLGVEMQVWWHGNGHGHGHGHGAQAKAQVQFTAKRLRSFTQIAAQSLAVAVTSALSNDGAGP